jgi:hypothetical protein
MASGFSEKEECFLETVSWKRFLLQDCFSEIEEDEASPKSTERIRSPIRTEAIGFLGLPFFRPNKMQVYNTTSRVVHLVVYDDENKTRSQVLMAHRPPLNRIPLVGPPLNASFGRAQIPLVPRDPQSEEVFCNYHVVVMRKYGCYEDGNYEEMPN